MTTAIYRASPDDAERLAGLAARTFSDAFAKDNRPEDVALFLSKNYGTERQLAEINDRRIITLLAAANGKLCGFAQVRDGAVEDCVRAPDPIELWRLYVDRPWHGRGVGQALMQEVDQAARARGRRTLWLGVWEHNQRAIAFYTRLGFRTVGSQTFMVGNDPQTDLVMLRPVAPIPR